MVSQAWTELEHVSAELEDLHHRVLFAQRHNRASLVRELEAQIERAEARRRTLVDRIMIGLAEQAGTARRELA